MTVMLQKTFRLPYKKEMTFSTFVCPSKQPNALQPIYNFIATDEFSEIFFLWGAAGSGKSHILQSTANYINNIGQKAFYLCLKEASEITPEIFDSLENFDLICLDNIDIILNNEKWQEAIFHCLEAAETANTKLILSSRNNVNETEFLREETKSRLEASYRHKLELLNEQELVKALKIRAKYRQIPINQEVLTYIINYAPRDSKSIFSILDKIGSYSLLYQKSITKKMIREILAEKH